MHNAKAKQAQEKAWRKRRAKEKALEREKAAGTQFRVPKPIPPPIIIHSLLHFLPKRKAEYLFAQNLSNVSFYGACQYLTHQKGAWIREPETWKPKSYNINKAFGSLARHLMVQYPVRDWLVGLYNAATYSPIMDLFPHLGQGGNIGKFFALRPSWPQLTKKQQHILNTTPFASLNFYQATRRAQALSFDAPERFATVLGNSFLGASFQADEPFWTTVIQWFCFNSLAPDQVAPLLDYIRHRKGQEPGFTMKGRTGTRLFLDMEVWHGEMAKVKKFGGSNNEAFNSSGYIETLQEIDDKTKWAAVELLTPNDLLNEGRELHHCAASYSYAIRAGGCSMWSLRRGNFKDVGVARQAKPRITVEIRAGAIVQARGFGNAYPDTEEKRALQHFALQNNLLIQSM